MQIVDPVRIFSKKKENALNVKLKYVTTALINVRIQKVTTKLTTSANPVPIQIASYVAKHSTAKVVWINAFIKSVITCFVNHVLR